MCVCYLCSWSGEWVLKKMKVKFHSSVCVCVCLYVSVLLVLWVVWINDLDSYVRPRPHIWTASSSSELQQRIVGSVVFPWADVDKQLRKRIILHQDWQFLGGGAICRIKVSLGAGSEIWTVIDHWKCIIIMQQQHQNKTPTKTEWKAGSSTAETILKCIPMYNM